MIKSSSVVMQQRSLKQLGDGLLQLRRLKQLGDIMIGEGHLAFHLQFHRSVEQQQLDNLDVAFGGCNAQRGVVVVGDQIERSTRSKEQRNALGAAPVGSQMECRATVIGDHVHRRARGNQKAHALSVAVEGNAMQS